MFLSAQTEFHVKYDFGGTEFDGCDTSAKSCDVVIDSSIKSGQEVSLNVIAKSGTLESDPATTTARTSQFSTVRPLSSGILGLRASEHIPFAVFCFSCSC